MRCLAVALALAVPLLPACAPKNQPVDSDGGGVEDLARAPRDLLPPADLLTPADLSPGCGPVAGNRITNPSFEADVLPGLYTARSSDDEITTKSTISGWRGCCPPSAASSYQVVAGGCSGAQALQVSSTNASANVVLQSVSPADGGGKRALVRVYARVLSIDAGGSLALDLFDVTGKAVLGTSAALTAITPGLTYAPLELSANLPAGTPSLQVRVVTSGTLRAYIDDFALTLP